MNVLLYLIPAALLLAGAGLAAFVWALRSGQFEDPAGSAARAIQDHERPDSRQRASLTDAPDPGERKTVRQPGRLTSPSADGP